MLVCEPVEFSLDGVTVSIPEDDALPWGNAVVYDLGDRVVRDHRIFESMEAANLGVDPATVDQSKVAAQWLEVAYTNAFSAFDGVLDNPTSTTDALSIAIDIEGSFDVVCLFGVRATSATARFYTTTGQLVATRTLLLGGLVVSGYWAWLHAIPNARRDKAVFDRVPVAARRVEIDLIGGAIRLGEVFLGKSYYVGETQPQTSGATATASGYDLNNFGRTTWVKRPTRRNMTYVVDIGRTAFESVEPLMGRLAGSLVATIGGVNTPSMVQFGILGTLDWVEDCPDSYLYSFTIKGIS